MESEPPYVGCYSNCREGFDAPQLPIDFQWLRTPFPEELFSLTARPGFLRLYGRETMGSLFRHSLVARRQQAHCFSATTVVEFKSEHFQQMAGLVCYYNSTKLHYLHISHDETLGKHLRVMSCIPDALMADAFTPPIAIPLTAPVSTSAQEAEVRIELIVIPLDVVSSFVPVSVTVTPAMPASPASFTPLSFASLYTNPATSPFTSPKL